MNVPAQAPVIELNEQALLQLTCDKGLAVVPGAHRHRWHQPDRARAGRKAGARPRSPDAAVSGGVHVLTPLSGLTVSPEAVAQVVAREQAALVRREQLYRSQRPAVCLTDRTVILVDDGLSTGATMRAAVSAIRQGGARLPRCPRLIWIKGFCRDWLGWRKLALIWKSIPAARKGVDDSRPDASLLAVAGPAFESCFEWWMPESVRGNRLSPRKTPRPTPSAPRSIDSQRLALRAGAARGAGRRCAACPCLDMGCATCLARHPWHPRRGPNQLPLTL